MEWSAALSYVFSVVGTSRCDVRAACSGTTPSNASVARIFVPPATTRAGTAQRAIPTIALNTDSGRGNPDSESALIGARRSLLGELRRWFVRWAVDDSP